MNTISYIVNENNKVYLNLEDIAEILPQWILNKMNFYEKINNEDFAEASQCIANIMFSYATLYREEPEPDPALIEE